VRFEVHGLPQTKGSTRAFARGSGAPVVVSDNARLKQWEQAVGWSARAAGASMNEGAVAVDVIFYLPRAKHTKEADALPTTRPDLDKLVRAVLDALTGICYADDGQVVHLTARKCYALDTPCALITVTG
jgi:Holliday junction resolvase RusA-like endonuclease